MSKITALLPLMCQGKSIYTPLRGDAGSTSGPRGTLANSRHRATVDPAQVRKVRLSVTRIGYTCEIQPARARWETNPRLTLGTDTNDLVARLVNTMNYNDYSSTDAPLRAQIRSRDQGTNSPK